MKIFKFFNFRGKNGEKTSINIDSGTFFVSSNSSITLINIIFYVNSFKNKYNEKASLFFLTRNSILIIKVFFKFFLENFY